MPFSIVAGLLLMSCTSPEQQSRMQEKSEPSPEQDQAKFLELMLVNEVLEFSPAFYRENQTKYMFRGKGSNSFWTAAVRCAPIFLFNGSPHHSSIRTPSQNSNAIPDHASDWSDQEVIKCFEESSRDDFYVTRNPNAAAIEGAPIMPGS